MLRAYLESIALIADADAIDPAQGAVTLMTLHAAKGLEFGAVAIVGLEEGLLPHSRALDSEVHLEEERRLCFVGITRAMRRLLLTSARYRTIRGLSERTIPSRFLDELDRSFTVFRDHSDTFAGLEDTEWSGGGDDAPAPSQHRPARPSPTSDRAMFPVGARVRHPQFGTGTVRSIISGANARAVVEFQSVGTKTLVLQYARLERIGAS
jgi:DNA helicase-2/ATP-dependent DNA helicase PcrA